MHAGRVQAQWVDEIHFTCKMQHTVHILLSNKERAPSKFQLPIVFPRLPALVFHAMKIIRHRTFDIDGRITALRCALQTGNKFFVLCKTPTLSIS